MVNGGDLQLKLDCVTRECRDQGWRKGQVAIRSPDNDFDHSAFQSSRRGRRRAGIRSVSRSPGGCPQDDGLGHHRANRFRAPCLRGWRCGCRRCLGSTLTSCTSGVLEVGERVRGAIKATVHGEDHSLIAVARWSPCALRTVEPNGIGLLKEYQGGWPLNSWDHVRCSRQSCMLAKAGRQRQACCGV